MPAPPATILITTRNRCDELCATLESSIRQTVPCEILVLDDGSTDDTPRVAPARFPQIRYVRHEQSAGLIVRRNEGARLASAPIVVSLDDDAVFPSPRTVEQSLSAFEHPRAGAVAIPFVDVKYSMDVRQSAPAGDLHATAAYIGTAHAIRRDLFLRLGGYRSLLFHQGEEPDYCIRMLAAGYVTVLVAADPIHHLESPKRDFTRMDLFGRRNDVLFAWHNVPFPQLIPNLAATTANGLLHGWRKRRLGNMIRGLARGYAATVSTRRERRPVPAWVYRLFRKLKKEGPIPLTQILNQLPDPVSIG